MLSLPATSQSVTVVNGDTLICLPDSIARKVIADLETGDFRKTQIDSYLSDIKNLKEKITVKEETISNYIITVEKQEGIIAEKDVQLGIKDKEIDVLKKEKKGKFWQGLGSGTILGAVATLALILL